MLGPNDGYIVPSVGERGSYLLSAPFDTLVNSKEFLTCKSVRKISELLANNEDPLKVSYDVYGIDPAIYAADLAADSSIAYLQSDFGHWYYVPVRYIITYGDTNGVPYRSYMLGISMPSLPVELDLSFIQTDIATLVQDRVGVNVVTKLVETSRPVLVTDVKHRVLSAERRALTDGNLTDRTKYLKLAQSHQAALDKIAELELYITNNFI